VASDLRDMTGTATERFTKTGGVADLIPLDNHLFQFESKVSGSEETGEPVDEYKEDKVDKRSHAWVRLLEECRDSGTHRELRVDVINWQARDTVSKDEPYAVTAARAQVVRPTPRILLLEVGGVKRSGEHHHLTRGGLRMRVDHMTAGRLGSVAGTARQADSFAADIQSP